MLVEDTVSYKKHTYTQILDEQSGELVRIKEYDYVDLSSKVSKATSDLLRKQGISDSFFPAMVYEIFSENGEYYFSLTNDIIGYFTKKIPANICVVNHICND